MFSLKLTNFELLHFLRVSILQRFFMTVGVCHKNCVFDSPWKASRASSALPLLVGENGSFEFSLPCLNCWAECYAAYGLAVNFIFIVGAAAFAFASFYLTLAKGTCDFLRKSSSITFLEKLFRLSPIFFVSEFYSFTATGYTLKLVAWSRFSNFGLLSVTDSDAARFPWFEITLDAVAVFEPPLGSWPSSNLLDRLNLVFSLFSWFASA